MTQAEAQKVLESGKSVLLTGAAGTGKTYLLQKFIQSSVKKGKSVAVTATTGLAATHLSGTTIHAWSGMGVFDDTCKLLFQRMGKARRERIRNTDILIIDEISMLHDFRLDMVDEIMREVRQNDMPFGGVQVVLCGDFFQLPPVNRRGGKQGGFITNSQVWHKNVFSVCYLEEQFRQKNDQQYAEILNGIRSGILKRSQLEMLRDRANAVAKPNTTYTRLLTVNVDVDAVNQRHLDEVEGKAYEYDMFMTGSKKHREQLLKSCLAQEKLKLKVGAQVMCIKNSQDRKYVNGSLGVVVDFEKATNHPIVELNSGGEVTIRPDSWELTDGEERLAMATQLPIRLAWAITVHKSQGMTLDAAHIDLTRAFVEGMGYVALSRVKSLETLILEGLNNTALRVSRQAREIDHELRTKSAALSEVGA